MGWYQVLLYVLHDGQWYALHVSWGETIQRTLLKHCSAPQSVAQLIDIGSDIRNLGATARTQSLAFTKSEKASKHSRTWPLQEGKMLSKQLAY